MHSNWCLQSITNGGGSHSWLLLLNYFKLCTRILHSAKTVCIAYKHGQHHSSSSSKTSYWKSNGIAKMGRWHFLQKLFSEKCTILCHENYCRLGYDAINLIHVNWCFRRSLCKLFEYVQNYLPHYMSTRPRRQQSLLSSL